MNANKFFNRLEDNFKAMKIITIVSIVFSALVTIAVYITFVYQLNEKDKIIYVLDNKAAIKARSLSISENREVEVRDQMDRFIELFFTLDPDTRVIRENISEALNISDVSVKALHDGRNESGYYSQLVNQSISTRIFTDSIRVDLSRQPYQVFYYGHQELIRLSTVSVRNLYASCLMRDVQRSNGNAHGLLIENFKIIDNQEIKLINR